MLANVQSAESDGAPLSQLLSDEQTASTAAAAVQNDLASQAINDMAMEMSDLLAIKADAAVVNHACGLPSTWHLDSVAVPGT